MSSRSDRAGRSHDGYRLLAAAAVDGRISPHDAVALEAHLATCTSCRADQRAMIADHVWLATPARVAPPNPRVRAVVLDAARSHRVPRTSGTRRPWTTLAAVAAILALITGGLILAGTQPPDESTPPSPTESRPPIPSAPPSAAAGLPRVEGSGSLAPLVGDGPERAFSVSISGGIVGPPSGSITFADAAGGSWTGSITGAGFWVEPNRSARLAFIQGCRTVTVCERFRVELLDSNDAGPDQIRVQFPGDPLENPASWEYTYEVADGSITINGELPSLSAVPSLGGGEMPGLPGDLSPFLQVHGSLDPYDFAGVATGVEGTIVGGTTGHPSRTAYPLAGHLTFGTPANSGWSLAPIKVDHWYEVTTRPGQTVAFVLGCVVADTCAPVAVLFVDNGDYQAYSPVYVAVGWTLPTADAGRDAFHYSIPDAALTVGGCMITVVQAEPQRSQLPDEHC